MISELEWAYYAGIVDGEGHIGLAEGNGHFRIPVLTIAQKDIWFIRQMLEDIPGGLLIPFSNTSKAWKANYNKAKDIKEILTKMLPYLKIKREVALVVLAVCSMSKGMGAHYTEVEQLTRHLLEKKFDEALATQKQRATEE